MPGKGGSEAEVSLIWVLIIVDWFSGRARAAALFTTSINNSQSENEGARCILTSCQTCGRSTKVISQTQLGSSARHGAKAIYLVRLKERIYR